MKKRLLLLGVLLLLLAVPVTAAEGGFDGYLVKLTPDCPRLLSDDSASDLLVVDTLEEAQAIPAEYVAHIEPNYYVELFDDGGEDWQPNDPLYAQYQWSLPAIGALAAYEMGLTGDGVPVGFVDSGVFAHHEDLLGQAITGWNCLEDGAEFYEDTHGHGTFAVGIIAAATDNELGLAGIAPGVEIHAYRAFSKKEGTIAAVVAGIQQAVTDGCRILNLSLGTSNSSAILQEAVEEAQDAGLIVIAAVGNSGTATKQYPAAYPGVIGVGAVGPGLEVWNKSQRNNSVFVTAPGVQIAGLGNRAANEYRLDLTAKDNSGTSYAAPVVTAMAAVALEYDDDITAEGIRYLLQQTSVDRGELGYDVAYGHGVVNMRAYLTELTRDFVIDYQMADGAVPEDAPMTYCVTDEDIMLPQPEREGYIFGGWYSDAQLTQPVEQIAAGSLGDRTFYACWYPEKSAVQKAEDGTIYCSVAQDGILLSVNYDSHGRMTGLKLVPVKRGELSVEQPEGLHEIVQLFLVAGDSFVPQCDSLIISRKTE